MLYDLFYSLKDFFSPFNVFQYITFRSAGAAITTAIYSLLTKQKPQIFVYPCFLW